MTKRAAEIRAWLEPRAEEMAALLAQLVAVNTENPPGNEAACIEFIRAQLEEAGCETRIYAKDPARPNLVSRLFGGSAPPLLLQGHVDVVTTAGPAWTHPPFEARLEDGYIWGRGALDMKGGVAMLVHAFLRAGRETVALPGDLVLVVLSDEEAGGHPPGQGYGEPAARAARLARRAGIPSRRRFRTTGRLTSTISRLQPRGRACARSPARPCGRNRSARGRTCSWPPSIRVAARSP